MKLFLHQLNSIEMNNQILKTSLIALLLILLSCSYAEAKIPVFFSFSGEQISKVVDFPNTEEYQADENIYIDAGCIYKQVSIFFIPIWNYDVRWCASLDGSEEYIPYSREELSVFAAAANVTLPEEPTIDFWNKIGGKLVFLLLIGAFIAYVALSPDEEEEAAEANAPTEEGK